MKTASLSILDNTGVSDLWWVLCEGAFRDWTLFHLVHLED